MEVLKAATKHGNQSLVWFRRSSRRELHIPYGPVLIRLVEILFLDVHGYQLIAGPLAILAVLQTLLQVLLESSVPPVPGVLMTVV